MRGLVVSALLLGLIGRAQDLSRFEVASIRPSPPVEGLPPGAMPPPVLQGGPGTADPGQIAYRGITLLYLVATAYGVKSNQVSGPDWPYRERFDLVARVPEGATTEQLKLMFQNLLLERFNLQLHHESRNLPVYELTVAKNGPKIKESPKVSSDAEPPPGGVVRTDQEGFPAFPPSRSGVAGMPSNGHMRVTGQRAAISKMTGLLMLDHPVVDHTGLTGEYDFKLDFAMATSRNDPASPGADADAPPGVFAAVEDQLGLKLESKKFPFDVLVIDHIDKEPSAN